MVLESPTKTTRKVGGSYDVGRVQLRLCQITEPSPESA